MSNDALRKAITDAGMDVDELAAIVEVDVKTVQRWISGRRPYTRLRGRVAKALGTREQVLWPDSRPSPARPSVHDDRTVGAETILAYNSSGDPDAPGWYTLMLDASEHIDLRDATLHDIVATRGVIELLGAKGASGCRVRINVAEPHDGWNAEWEDDPEYDAADDDDDPTNLARRLLAPLIGKPGIVIRQYVIGSPDSLLRFDDETSSLPTSRRPLVPRRRCFMCSESRAACSIGSSSTSTFYGTTIRAPSVRAGSSLKTTSRGRGDEDPSTGHEPLASSSWACRKRSRRRKREVMTQGRSTKAEVIGQLGDGAPYYAPVGEMRYDGDHVQCHLCGRWLKMVGGSHLVNAHGITLEEYREMFRLYESASTARRKRPFANGSRC